MNRLFTIPMFFSALLLLATMSPQATAEPDPALELFYSANALYNRKLYDLAAEQYRQFLDKNGKHEKAREARFGYGASLFGAGKMEPAAKALAELAGDPKSPNREQVHLLLGQSLLALKRAEEAEKAFREALRQVKDNKQLQERYLAGLAEALYLQQKAKELAEVADQLAGLKDDSPFATRALFQAALLLHQNEKFAEAAERFQKIAGKDKALDQQVHFLWGESLRQNNDLKGAAVQYEKAAEAGSGWQRVDSLFRLGWTRFSLGDLEGARQPLEQFLKESKADHPAAGQARLYLGRVHLESGKPGEAVKIFEELGKQSGFEAQAALWRGKALLRLENKAREAEAALSLARTKGGAAEAAEAAQLLAYHHYQQ